MIDAATLAGFRQEGAAVLRQVFTADAIDTLRAGIDLNLANLSPRAKLASSADDPAALSRIFATGRTIRTTCASSSTQGLRRLPAS
jgi:hypothetical protein